MKNIICFFLLFTIALSFAQHDTTFVNIKSIAPDIVLDLKYATADNFLKKPVYDCAECYLRKSTAVALARANTYFMKKGYKIKVFDCYRPLDVQKKMWAIVPNPNYVADPATGSIHNRGGAVDLTLVDMQGKELDMGTAFDHFGPASAHGYQQFPANVLANRKLLREGMVKFDFTLFNTEWWHYSSKGASRQKVANFAWECLN